MMVNPSKAKGTGWESAIVTCMVRAGWPDVERRALQGILDRGDIAGGPGVVIEAKNARQVCLAGWLDEANAEADNANADVGAVWFKRRGKTNPLDGYVLMDGATFLWLLRKGGYAPSTNPPTPGGWAA